MFAFGELKDELSKVDELRFIFDEPTFAKQMEHALEPREFAVRRRSREKGVGGTGLELTLRNNLNQRALARQCAEWVRQRATFKTARQRGMIATTGSYHVENPHVESHAFMGSAANAFTLEGLGYERRPGVVTGISHFQTSAEAIGLKCMFDSVWDNPVLVEDVTEQVIEQVSTLYRENPPEFVYFLTLYHLFRDFMEDEVDDPIRSGLRFEEPVVWGKLYDFQRDAVVGAIRKLEKYKGCIIADSVGLGKTYEALAVIKYYEERNGRVLVLCPKRLRDNWTLWTRGNDERNPLADDRLAYDVLNHTDLSRYSGMSGDIDLEYLRWGNYDLLVIDESHNFRNKSTDAEKKDRYTRLIDDVIRSGVRTKVLMLSATPVNNKLLDLRNQIELITEGDDEYLAETDGIPSITQVTRVAQQRFNEWSKLDDSERTTESFVNAVNADYFKLLDVLTIARSRKHITKYYGAASGTFPTRRLPISFQTPIDARGELPPIAELNDMIAQLTFAQYQVLSYVRYDQQAKYEARYGDTWGKDFQSQVNRTTAVANLMCVNVLKRMESSVNSFRITLRRILDDCVDLRSRLDNVGASVSYDMRGTDTEFDDDDDAEEFVAGGKVHVDLRDVDHLRLRADLDFDIKKLTTLLKYADAVTPERDAKLIKLREFIAEKVAHPYNAGNRKILMFSAFADTTDYLFDQLAGPLSKALRVFWWVARARTGGPENPERLLGLPSRGHAVTTQGGYECAGTRGCWRRSSSARWGWARPGRSWGPGLGRSREAPASSAPGWPKDAATRSPARSAASPAARATPASAPGVTPASGSPGPTPAAPCRGRTAPSTERGPCPCPGRCGRTHTSRPSSGPRCSRPRAGVEAPVGDDRRPRDMLGRAVAQARGSADYSDAGRVGTGETSRSKGHTYTPAMPGPGSRRCARRGRRRRLGTAPRTCGRT